MVLLRFCISFIHALLQHKVTALRMAHFEKINGDVLALPLVNRYYLSWRCVFSFASFALIYISFLSRMAFSDWLRYSLSILLQIVRSAAVCASQNKMTAHSLRFRSVCEEDLGKVLNDQQISAKAMRLFALDYCA